MNKNRLILFIIALVILIGGYFAVREIMSYHKVTFTYGDHVSAVKVYINDVNADAPKELASIESSNSSVTLREGYYRYESVGENVSKTSTPFTVSGDMTIEASAEYSETYLASRAAEQLPAINSALKTAYPSAMNTYEINNIALLKKADWAVVVLSKIGSDNNNPAPFYRAILKKQSANIWQVVSKPQLVITKFNTPDVEDSILRSANDLSPR